MLMSLACVAACFGSVALFPLAAIFGRVIENRLLRRLYHLTHKDKQLTPDEQKKMLCVETKAERRCFISFILIPSNFLNILVKHTNRGKRALWSVPLEFSPPNFYIRFLIMNTGRSWWKKKSPITYTIAKHHSDDTIWKDCETGCFSEVILCCARSIVGTVTCWGGGEWVLILILNDNTHHRSLQRVGRMDISVSPVVLQQREISS